MYIKISWYIIAYHAKTAVTVVYWHWTSKTGGGLNASFVMSSVAMSVVLLTQKNRDIWAGSELWHFRYFSSLITAAKLTVACIFLWSIIMHWCWCSAGSINAWVAVWGEKKFLSGNEGKLKTRSFMKIVFHLWNFHQTTNITGQTCSRLLRSAYRNSY